MGHEGSGPEREEGTRFSRRSLIKGVGTGVAGAVVAGSGSAQAPQVAPFDGQRAGPGSVRITLNINGKNETLDVEPRTTLINALREYLPPERALTGAKIGCDRGSCGACTVLIDGKPAYSCLLLAIDCVNRKITTVEGLAQGGRLTPVQQAMVEHDGLMCGFCTPGFVISLEALLSQNPNPTLEDVKRAISGNLCRCGAYPNIFKAALAAARARRGG